jgi:deoxyadenosine/deoxycytidine kinase
MAYHIIKVEEIIQDFNMKIGFCGSVSVGKTTLVKALQQLPEFEGYTFSTERSKYLRDLGIPLNTDSTIKGQMVFLAERASELFQNNVITDRTIIDVMAFTKLAKSIPYYIADEYNTLASRLISEYDYIFYISPDGVDIEDNGVRTIDPKYRMKIDKEIKHLISQYSNKFKRYHELSGTTEERIEKIKQVLFP